MTLVPDTMNGALLLSVFDFVACFFVLWLISFFIRGLRYFDEKASARAAKKPAEDNEEEATPSQK